MTGLLRPQAGRVLYKGVDVSMRYPLTLQDMFLVPDALLERVKRLRMRTLSCVPIVFSAIVRRIIN